jgi:hypothetical protein
LRCLNSEIGDVEGDGVIDQYRVQHRKTAVG